MPYIQRKIFAGKTIGVEKVYSGRYGRKSGRGEREKPTPEAMARYNERQAAKKLRWTLNENFGKGDYHVTLTYAPVNRTDKREAEKRVTSFLRKLKRRYKKYGVELKWVKVTEYERKAIHHHIILNGFVKDGVSADGLIAECWPWGRPKFVKMDENGDYRVLAEYLIKETSRTFREENGAGKKRYSCSRNLRKPRVEVRKMEAKEWRKDPKAPKGWYIDKESFYDGGFNEITGRRCQYYTCIRLPEKGRKRKGEEGKYLPGA